MVSHFRRINHDLIMGWIIISIVLLVTYTIEVFKGERTLAYLLVFIPVVTIPLILAIIIYMKKQDWPSLCYFTVAGYFVMYLFVMFTGSTSMVFSYILPMLSLLVLYHHPNLILFTGIAALIANLISLFQRYQAGLLNVSNSKDAEIQLALIILCFGGSYIAARLYEDITIESNEYLKMLSATHEEVENMSFQSITIVANMLDARDSYTEGHSQRVAVYSSQIAQGLGMAEEEVENVRKIALLHDIGKIGVPDALLNKPSRLTDEEFITMKEHSTVGAEIIKNVKNIPGIYEGVRYHHERYDGKGYPDGLKGEDIPYVARIIAVADSFDAMTTNRVYRKHLSYEQVLSELEKGTGTQFDPAIARIMINMLKMGTLKNYSPDMEKTGK